MTDFLGVDMYSLAQRATARTNAAQHGGPGKYRQGCRCDECKTGQNQRMRDYNANKRQSSGVTVPDCIVCHSPLSRASINPRPMHKACKASAPRWLKDGRPDPAIERAAREAEQHARRLAGLPDPRSLIRIAWEDGTYEQFINALAARVTVNNESCWEWQGQLGKGYPLVRFGKRKLQVHRLVIEKREGMQLGVLAAHHKCANASCVNPDHLQPVTQRENVAEMIARNSLEARIAELEAALESVSPRHPALHRVSHLRIA
jgi:hypothetical protein